MKKCKAKTLGVYTLIFGLIGVIVLFGFTLWAATPIIMAVCMLLALVTGIMGLIKAGHDNDQKTIALSVVGIALAIIPALVAILALW